MNNKFSTKEQETSELPLSSGIDFYKFTMGQLAYEKYPEAEVTFTLKNRDSSRPLTEFVEPKKLQEKFNHLAQKGFTQKEIDYLDSLKNPDQTKQFDEKFINHLKSIKLPKIDVSVNSDTQDLECISTGNWVDVSFWETVVMSEINDEYFRNKLKSEQINLQDIENEGYKRLKEKLQILKSRPDILISDSGTRRRFSSDWQQTVIENLVSEIPNNLLGTSNVWFSNTFGIKPNGTMAHEMPMVYAAIENSKGNNPLNGHGLMFSDWEKRYGQNASVALTDTFTTDFFLKTFTADQLKAWKALRHDSGNPFRFGDKVIQNYLDHGINPKEKTIVFSDGLNLEKILKLADYFKDKINFTFGWGTSLTNDLGLKANNIVMKATQVNGVSTVKLSDDFGKHTGTAEKINFYQAAVQQVLNN